jgi:hypothetical protein
MEQMVFSVAKEATLTGRTFFYLPLCSKIFFGGLDSRKNNILLRGKKYSHSRKNARKCEPFAFLVSYGI